MARDDDENENGLRRTPRDRARAHGTAVATLPQRLDGYCSVCGNLSHSVDEHARLVREHLRKNAEWEQPQSPRAAVTLRPFRLRGE